MPSACSASRPPPARRDERPGAGTRLAPRSYPLSPAAGAPRDQATVLTSRRGNWQLPEDAVLARPSLAVGHLDRRLARLSRSVRFLGLLHPTEGNDTGRVPRAATAASNASPETPEAGEARPTSGSASALLPSAPCGVAVRCARQPGRQLMPISHANAFQVSPRVNIKPRAVPGDERQS
jgi:hypothetical protein